MKLINMLKLINITYLSIFNELEVLSGCLNAAKTGNAGLKREIRKMYEYCVKLRKVKCDFSNRIKMN